MGPKNVRQGRSRTDAIATRAGSLWPFFLALTAAAGAVYANSLSGSFLFDDDLGIVQNASISGWNLSKALRPARELPVAGRPLVNLSLAANHAIGGLNVAAYHVVNISLHIACGLLLFGIVRRTIERWHDDKWHPRAAGVAFAAALIWLVHPLASEPVDYVSQRTESMMACALLVTVYASLRALTSERHYWTVIAVTACAAGMACKESMVTAPVVVVMYDAVFAFNSVTEALRRRWRFYGALASTWLILAYLLRNGPRAYSAGFGTRVTVADYLLNQPVMIVRYLRLVLWPRELVLWYGPTLPIAFSRAVGPLALVGVLMAITAWALRRAPAAGFLGAFAFITLAPTSSIVPIATEVGAERRMYLPLMAIVTLAVVAVVYAWDIRGRSRTGVRVERSAYAGVAVLLLVSVPLAAATIARNVEYRSPLGMARTLVERWPTGGAHFLVGTELAALNQHNDALAEFRLAVDTFPRARYYLGSELLTAGRSEEAIEQLRAFIHAEPLLLEVIQAHLKIGEALTRAGQWPSGEAEFRQVLSMTPSNADAAKLLAGALMHEGRAEEATRYYRQYLAARPRDVNAETEFGIALAQTGQHDEEAVRVFASAVELDPGNAALHENLARALLIRDNFRDAKTEAREAIRLDPRRPSAHDLLGEALVMEGDLLSAETEFQGALRLDPSDAAAVAAMRQLRNLPVR